MREIDFLMAIKEDPSDDSLRLIFSDWLREQGKEELGTYIKFQVLHAKGQVCKDWPNMHRFFDGPDSSIRDVCRPLRTANKYESFYYHWWRGLLQLQVDVTPSGLKALAAVPKESWPWIEGLWIKVCRISPFDRLLKRKCLNHVRSLCITPNWQSSNFIGRRVVDLLLCDRLSCLYELKLDVDSFTQQRDYIFGVLLGSKYMKNLRVLDLTETMKNAVLQDAKEGCEVAKELIQRFSL